MKKTRKALGFTLIELMIVVAIMGILVAIALPSYTKYIQRGYRANAKAALFEAAQYMERYRSINFKYNEDNAATPVANALPTYLSFAPKEGGKRYDITVVFDATSFTLTATPSGWVDSLCGALTLNNLGEKGQDTGVTYTATCWNR